MHKLHIELHELESAFDSDSLTYYLNRQTGELHCFSDYNDEPTDLDLEELESDNRYLRLPNYTSHTAYEDIEDLVMFQNC